MKLKVSKPDTEVEDDPPKKKKLKLKGGAKETTTQYGTYSGIVGDDGKTVRNPSEEAAIKNMVGYLKNNNPPESDKPSNVYRPQLSHIGIVYDRKKKQTNT